MSVQTVTLAGLEWPLSMVGPYWVRQEIVQQAQQNQVLAFAAALGLSLKEWPGEGPVPVYAYNVISYGEAVFGELMRRGASGEEVSHAATRAWLTLSKAHAAPVELAKTADEGKPQGQGS